MWDDLEEITREKKRCCKCKKLKLLTEFCLHSRTSDGLQPYCKECQTETSRNCKYRTQKGYLDLPLTRNQYDKLKRSYSATHEQIERYVYTVSCDLCSKDLPLGVAQHKHFDHCHVTGVHRAVLCADCNSRRLPTLEELDTNPSFRENAAKIMGWRSITIVPHGE